MPKIRSNWVTFNMWRDNTRSGVVSDLMDEMSHPNTHVINLQEAKNWTEEIHRVCRAMSEDDRVWELLLPPNNLGEAARNCVTIYRSDVLEAVDVRWHDLPNKVQIDRWVAEATFRYRRSKHGRMVRNLNSHLHPHIARPAWWDLPRQPEAREHIRWMAERSDDAPSAQAVVTSADWNVNLKSRIYARFSFFPVKRFRRVGMRSNWHIAGFGPTPTKGRVWIDGSFVRQRHWFKVVKNLVFKKRSDHNLVRMVVEVEL